MSFTENDPTQSSPFTFAISGVGTSAPQMSVTGNGNSINDGANTTSAVNATAFGSVSLGSSISELYTINNNGSAALTLGTVSVSGANAGDFSIVSSPGSSVAAGSSATLIIQFQPTAAGTRNATVSFNENDPLEPSPFTFAISGVGTAVAQISLTGNGNSINDGASTTSATNGTSFGSTPQGSTVSELYTITNNGSAPLSLGTVSIAGANPQDFSVISAPASSVAAGSSTTMIIQFQPIASGTRSATVSFTENDPSQSSPFTFAISGVGTAVPQMSLTGNGNPIADASSTPSAANGTAFGSTPQGSTISELYTITNNGSAALSLGTVSLTGTNAGDFSVVSAPATSVAAGSSTTMILQFQPTATGTRTATVNFTENDPLQASPFTFAINGVGTAAAQMSITGNGNTIVDGSSTPSATNGTAFGSTPPQSTISELYTITNNGTASLSLGTVSLSGANAGDFSVTTRRQAPWPQDRARR